MKQLFHTLFLLLGIIQMNAQGFLTLQELDNRRTYEFKKIPNHIDKDSIVSVYFYNVERLPYDLTRLKNLHAIHFYSCAKLDYDEVLKECSKFQHLIEITISATFQKEFPTRLYTFKNLKRLTIAGNEYGTIPNGLKKLKNLEVLNLGNGVAGGNRLTTLPKEILKLPKLRALNVEGNMQMIYEDHFYQLSQLEEINLKLAMHIDLERFFKSFPNLKILDLTAIGERTWTGISNLKKLETLSIDYDRDLKSLGDDFHLLNNLKTLQLNMEKSWYKKSEIEKIAALPKLERLTLLFPFKYEGNECILPNAGFPALKELFLQHGKNVSFESIAIAVVNYPSLELLSAGRALKTEEDKAAFEELSGSINVLGIQKD